MIWWLSFPMSNQVDGEMVHGVVVALCRSTAPTTTTTLPQANLLVLLQRYQINGGLAESMDRSADDRHAIPMLWCPKRLARPSELLTANSSDRFFCGRKQERFQGTECMSQIDAVDMLLHEIGAVDHNM
ncbi:hypothetical protein B296_00013912 [Ensete ventricosum]|uniref:Uncharacterized protein n=1 Tax=Ensete ventricosum TaxID=4639 RepID=A0A426Z3L4_ENSVE|nr:hypothetical protein B296_00013912 [Ensete ventricosum]